MPFVPNDTYSCPLKIENLMVFRLYIKEVKWSPTQFYTKKMETTNSMTGLANLK